MNTIYSYIFISESGDLFHFASKKYYKDGYDCLEHAPELWNEYSSWISDGCELSEIPFERFDRLPIKVLDIDLH